MACPDAQTLQALFAGQLDRAGREAVLSHADGCEECRTVLAALARASAPDPSLESRLAAATPQRGERTSSPVLTQGTRVGRYEIESFRAAGGLGLVYVARDTELGRRVALKLLKLDAGDQVRLMREAQAMARVSHPNVVAVFDVGEWQGRIFLAMELVEGVDLRAWLAAGSRRRTEIVDVFRAAGRGLAAAHAAGLVHRDFKPDNVLVDADGRARVTDFGLARAVDVAAPKDELIAGTPAYMAPEQHRGEPAFARTDQFAFCVALYEALYRERPFAGEDQDTVRAAVLDGRVRPAPQRPRVPRTLRRILLRGMSPRPGDRFPTMDALLGALGRDRTKIPRRVGEVALGLLAVLATAWLGDRIVRARLYAVARASFAAAGAQIERTMAWRNESFSALASVSALVPIMRQVAGTRDESDFGLGASVDDTRRLEALHASLRDADWRAWSLVTRRGHAAIADYKGRLLYSTADTSAFGRDVRVVPAVAAAFGLDAPGASAQVLRATDSRLSEAGLGGGEPGSLVVVFAHASVLGGVPQAMFIQTLDGRHLLDELRLDAQTRLALMAPDGSTQGDVAPAIIGKARDSLHEVAVEGRLWLVQAQPVPDLGGGGPPIARLVLARPADVGLAGLFPHARGVLLALGGFALAVLAWALARMISSG
ncbi:MAG TPA: protein kinase [Polyangia bacterium]|nr:protein kinase [Polyangia bacterium]